MISEAIILAGGLGTRLRSAVPDLPKCMAPVNDQPFLKHVIEHLQAGGIEMFIFSLGYMHEAIVAYLERNFPSLKYAISIEDEPLGTGGAIKVAITKAKEKAVLVTNGDTLFKIGVQALGSVHLEKQSDCTLSLKPMQNFERYGVVEVNKEDAITNFKEKHFYQHGLINGGIYAVNKDKFLQENLPEKFSFEKDYLEKYYAERRMFGFVQDEYFIDIGIPEDFQRAQIELKK